MKLQIVVRFLGVNDPRYFPVETFWKLDTEQRQLLIGKGLGRIIMVPLDNVAYYSVEVIRE